MRDVSRAPYYRSSPVAILQYAYAKWMFSLFRETDPLKFLESIGIDANAALQGLERWRILLERSISLIQLERDGQGGVSFNDGLILYGLVRALRPDFVVETGIAAGISTSFLGAALIECGQGTLFSIELPATTSGSSCCPDGSVYLWQERGVGWAIPAEIKAALQCRHEMILHDVRDALPALLKRIPYIDIFFHDDLHTPDHMLWEYSLIWPTIRSGGVVVSDDSNFGWLQFCRKLGRNERKETLRNIDRLTALRK